MTRHGTGRIMRLVETEQFCMRAKKWAMVGYLFVKTALGLVVLLPFLDLSTFPHLGASLQRVRPHILSISRQIALILINFRSCGRKSCHACASPHRPQVRTVFAVEWEGGGYPLPPASAGRSINPAGIGIDSDRRHL